MKTKKEIARYKLDTCLTCGRKQAKTVAGRCIEAPYCYERHRKDVREARNAERGIQPETKVNKPINKISDKRAKLDRIYNILATQFKKDKPMCEARLPGCQTQTHHVHHLFSGASRSKYYLDSSTWKSCCDNCHHLIHDVMSMEELIQLDLKRVE